MLNLSCILCNENTHVERDCPRTFYEKRRVALCIKLGASPKVKVNRGKFDRKTLKLKYHSLGSLPKIA